MDQFAGCSRLLQNGMSIGKTEWITKGRGKIFNGYDIRTIASHIAMSSKDPDAHLRAVERSQRVEDCIVFREFCCKLDMPGHEWHGKRVKLVWSDSILGLQYVILLDP